MMVVMSLFPGGVLQVWDVAQHGYWHAREIGYTGSARAHLIEWLRLPGDLVFIIFGSLPLAIAALKSYFGMRSDQHRLSTRPDVVSIWSDPSLHVPTQLPSKESVPPC